MEQKFLFVIITSLDVANISSLKRQLHLLMLTKNDAFFDSFETVDALKNVCAKDRELEELVRNSKIPFDYIIAT